MKKQEIENTFKKMGLTTFVNRSGEFWVIPGKEHIIISIRDKWMYDKDDCWYIFINNKDYIPEAGIENIQNIINDIFNACFYLTLPYLPYAKKRNRRAIY